MISICFSWFYSFRTFSLSSLTAELHWESKQRLSSLSYWNEKCSSSYYRFPFFFFSFHTLIYSIGLKCLVSQFSHVRSGFIINLLGESSRQMLVLRTPLPYSCLWRITWLQGIKVMGTSLLPLADFAKSTGDVKEINHVKNTRNGVPKCSPDCCSVAWVMLELCSTSP